MYDAVALHRLTVRDRPENQMQVTRMEAVCDPAAGLRENSVLFADAPIAGECH